MMYSIMFSNMYIELLRVLWYEVQWIIKFSCFVKEKNLKLEKKINLKFYCKLMLDMV